MTYTNNTVYNKILLKEKYLPHIKQALHFRHVLLPLTTVHLLRYRYPFHLSHDWALKMGNDQTMLSNLDEYYQWKMLHMTLLRYIYAKAQLEVIQLD